MNRYLSLFFIAATLLALHGCATAITKGADRRTEGAYIEDSTIEDTANTRIKNKYRDTVHINVNSYNRKVLITGEVPDEATKSDMFRIAGTVQNVTDIHNEVIIGPHSSLAARSNDALTTSNVYYRLRDSGKDFFRADRVKIITERNTVYLLGLVTHAEAAVATEIASTSSGVKKVVPFFEFID